MTNHGRSDDVLLRLRAGDQAVEDAVMQTPEPASMGLFALVIAAFSRASKSRGQRHSLVVKLAN